MISATHPSVIKSLSDHTESFLNFSKDKVSKWMPTGFLPRVVIWLSAESIGALAFDKLSEKSLIDLNAYLDETRPYYHTLPLIATGGILSYYTFFQPKKISNLALSLISIVAIFMIYSFSMEEINKGISKIYGLGILHLTSMMVSILGGYAALRVTGCDEKFESYRFKMVEHTVAGKMFDLVVISPKFFPLKIIRHISKVILQSFVYNRKDLFRAFKASVRRNKSYGVITPYLARTLYSRFESIDKIKLSNQLVDKVAPFFSQKSKSLLATKLAYTFFDHRINGLKDISENLIHLLSRSLIKYSKIIENKDIKTLTRCLREIAKESHDLGTLKELTEKLKSAVEKAVKNEIRSYPIQSKFILDKFIWNEQNISCLSETLKQILTDLGVYLMGYNIYPKDHVQFIDLILRCHLKPFLTLVFFDKENIDQMNVALSETEDLELTLLVQKIAFDALVHPLLPKLLSQTLFFSMNASLESLTTTLHKLQGFRPKTSLFSKIAIDEAYVQAPIDLKLDRASLNNIQETYFQKPPRKEVNNSDEDFVVIEKGVAPY
jgi:hypothetical protein